MLNNKTCKIFDIFKHESLLKKTKYCKIRYSNICKEYHNFKNRQYSKSKQRKISKKIYLNIIKCEEGVYKLNHHTNIQYLLKEDNRKKVVKLGVV